MSHINDVGAEFPRPLKREMLRFKIETGAEGAPLRTHPFWLHQYTKLSVFITFLLVVAGGLVTSTGSGLAVPDWPLSYGKLMPPMVGGIRYEHTHRMIASLVGLMTLVFSLWLGFSEKRHWLRWAGILAFGMVVAQGILGGLTVLYLLPPAISIFHACLAQTFFAFIVCLAYVTSGEWNEAAAHVRSAPLSVLKKLLYLLLVFIYAQLILGATFRHTGNRLVLIPHIAGAFLVLVHAVLIWVFAAKNMTGDKKLIYPASALGLLSLVQISLGMGSFIFVVALKRANIPPGAGQLFFVTTHQTLGALLLATAAFFTLRVVRFGRQ